MVYRSLKAQELQRRVIAASKEAIRSQKNTPSSGPCKGVGGEKLTLKNAADEAGSSWESQASINERKCLRGVMGSRYENIKAKAHWY